MDKTFQQLNAEARFVKEIKKSGLSYALIFSKEEMTRFNLKYLDIIDLSDAKPIKLEENFIPMDPTMSEPEEEDEEEDIAPINPIIPEVSIRKEENFMPAEPEKPKDI
jgi:hypothetical protein